MAQDTSVSDLVRGLQHRVDQAIGGHLTAPSFALVDFPDHPNVGDSAIWLGEVEYFRQVHGMRPAYVCRHGADFSAEELAARCPDGPVFIHGGGNFGDIWGHHQKFREHLLESLKHRKIVQLPQSIHFASEARRDQTARLIAAHPDFTLLVRDRESLALARERFDCPSELAPDMAFCIGEMPADAPEYDVLALLRTDHERVDLGSVDAAVRVEDWLSEPSGAVRAAKAVGSLEAVVTFRPGNWKEGMLTAAARHRVNRGRAQLSRARAIVTDRLHVHILSLLLGRPHAVLDNSYGKIARFMAAWTEASSITHRADGMAAALAWAAARARHDELEPAL